MPDDLRDRYRPIPRSTAHATTPRTRSTAANAHPVQPVHASTVSRHPTPPPPRPQPQHGSPETLAHAVDRMRRQGYSTQQLAGQIRRWHPGLSPTQARSIVRAARNPVAHVNRTAALPRTAHRTATTSDAAANCTPLIQRQRRETGHLESIRRFAGDAFRRSEHAVSAAGDEIARSARSLGLTKKYTLPNPDFLTGPLNTLYGEFRVAAGVSLFAVGTAEDVTGIGAVLGLPTQAAAAYLVATGSARTLRGVRETQRAIEHPTVRKSALRYGADVVIEVAPGGGFVNFAGGLP